MTKQNIVYCKKLGLRLEVLSFISPQQPLMVESDLALFRAIRKNPIDWILLIPPLELELNRVIAKIKTETTIEPKILVLSSAHINISDESIPFLLGAGWRTYFLEWFSSSLGGEIPKISTSTAIGLSSRLNSVIKRLRLLRRIR